MVTYLGSLVQSCCGEGGTLQTNITGMCGECSQCACSVGATLGLPPLTVCVLSQFTLLRLRLLCLQLSEVGPGLRVLPRSKPFRFRFRFSGTPQRHRLSWTCVLCPSHVRAAQATRCLTSTVTPRCGVSYTSPIPAAQFAGWQQACPSQVGRVSLLGS